MEGFSHDMSSTKIFLATPGYSEVSRLALALALKQYVLELEKDFQQPIRSLLSL